MDKKLIMEFIGTFFLVLTVALTGNALAIGGVLVALVYMGGYISGAHYNPAVTLAFIITKKIEQRLAIKYILTQIVAGIAAAAAYYLIQAVYFVPQVAAESGAGSAFLIEVLFTFLLCTVVLNVAATDKVKDNQYYGIAIGFTLMAAVFAGSSISGGAFNPAVGASPLLFDYSNLSTRLTELSLYFIGPATGGVLAGLMYQMTHKRSLLPFVN